MARTIGNLLNDVLQQYGLTQRLKEFQAVEAWPEVVGENIAKITLAREVRDGRLYVEVSSTERAGSAWRNELYFLKADIIEKLNKKSGQNIIHDIMFV
mgnify:CR=1 FL=1